MELCKLCNQKEPKYVCPRCNIPYCSVSCYQTEAHAQCSESFYKECVERQLKDDELDPQSQKRMLEILQRVQDNDGVQGEIIDSDDDSSGDELAARLAGVDLDDADSVWERLTGDEKRQFEELLRSGDVTEVLPSWQPWWYFREKKNLVEDLDGDPGPDQNPGLEIACPSIKQDIQPFSKLSKLSPSPCVRWNVVNVLAAYSLTARVYNGDLLGSAGEAAMTLLSLSDNLASNQLFESPELAVAAVHLAAVNSNCIVGGVEETQLKEDVQRLVEGPSETRQNHFVLAALSDVHSLLTAAKHTARDNTKSKTTGEFSKRFPKTTSGSTPLTSVSELKKCLKKIEFYLSWANKCF